MTSPYLPASCPFAARAVLKGILQTPNSLANPSWLPGNANEYLPREYQFEPSHSSAMKIDVLDYNSNSILVNGHEEEAPDDDRSSYSFAESGPSSSSASDSDSTSTSPVHFSPSGETGPWSSSENRMFSSETFDPEQEAKHSFAGAGLENLGNTCFMNAILQCFTHTVPFVDGLRSANHKNCCNNGSEAFCALCALRDHIELAISSSGMIISPDKLVDNLNHISSYFRRYQQEDAHEFLQCFLDKLQKCCFDSKANDELVENVFGGHLISELRCCNCGHCSDSYEPLIDLSLEIENVDSLLSALESFTKVEKIETQFTCENCKAEVSKEKQLILNRVPSVATFHLKRFKADGSSVEKIDKHVEFPLELDLKPYTTGKDDANVEVKYELYAVVKHRGCSPIAGHYFSFIRSSPDIWYKLDDSTVTRVHEDDVLSQEAYILFYMRQGTPWFSSLMEIERLKTSPKSVLESIDNGYHWCAAGDTMISFNNSTETAVSRRTPTSFSHETENEVVKAENSPIVASETSEQFCHDKSAPGGNDNQWKIDELIDNDHFCPLTPIISPTLDIDPSMSPRIKNHSSWNPQNVSGRRSTSEKPLNKVLKDDSERKEALRYVQKSGMPSSRYSGFVAALNKRKASCLKADPPNTHRKSLFQ